MASSQYDEFLDDNDQTNQQGTTPKGRFMPNSIRRAYSVAAKAPANIAAAPSTMTKFMLEMYNSNFFKSYMFKIMMATLAIAAALVIVALTISPALVPTALAGITMLGAVATQAIFGTAIAVAASSSLLLGLSFLSSRKKAPATIHNDYNNTAGQETEEKNNNVTPNGVSASL